MTNDVWKRVRERAKVINSGSVDFIILLKSGCCLIKFQIGDFRSWALPLVLVALLGAGNNGSVIVRDAKKIAIIIAMFNVET